MAQAKGMAARLSYVEEVTRGTTPGSPSMKQLVAATYGETLSAKFGSVMSASMKGTRGRATPRQGKKAVDGSVPFELAPLGIATLLKHALGSNATTGAGPYTHTIKRGALLAGLTIEKAFTDLGRYFTNTGCLINRLSLQINGDDSLVTGSFDFIGMGSTSGGASLGTPTAVTHNPFTNWEVACQEGGVTATLLNFSLDYNNDIERVNAIGSQAAVGLNEGEGMADVTATLLFDSMTQVDKFLNETVSSMQIAGTQGANSVTLLFPKVKYFGDSIPKIATPRGIVVPLAGTVYYDSTELTDVKATIVNTEATI